MKYVLTIFLSIALFQCSAQSHKYFVMNGDTLFLKNADGSDSLQLNKLSRVWGTFIGNIEDQSDLMNELYGKQDTLTSGANIKTINGASVLGSGDLVVSGGGLGYTLSVQALTSSPADGATIYFGQLPKAPTTSAAISKVYIRKAGTIKAANIYSYAGTAGTNEAWVAYIRVNNTTDYQIASVSAATNERVWSNTGLSIAVSVGDYIETKFVNPTWATNPLTFIVGGYYYIE